VAYPRQSRAGYRPAGRRDHGGGVRRGSRGGRRTGAPRTRRAPPTGAMACYRWQGRSAPIPSGAGCAGSNPAGGARAQSSRPRRRPSLTGTANCWSNLPAAVMLGTARLL